MTVKTWNGIPASNGLQIGDALGGGYYAGKIAVGGGGTATHYLIVAPKATGENASAAWGPTATTSITSVITGPANSIALALLADTYTAARWCESLEIGGYTDWYLPAQNELEVLYYNLKPGTTANSTNISSGSNANAVSPEPVSTVYTAGAPAQTSATAFRTGASSQEFVEGYYWSSTEYDGLAWAQTFTNGFQYYGEKGLTLPVRAVRRIAI